jgi:hypothetical protein
LLYSQDSEKVLVFDKYHELSAKDHERMQCGDKSTTNYNLSINSLLPNRDVTMFIAYLLKAAEFHRVVRILSDDTDVIVIADILGMENPTTQKI